MQAITKDGTPQLLSAILLYGSRYVETRSKVSFSPPFTRCGMLLMDRLDHTQAFPPQKRLSSRHCAI